MQVNLAPNHQPCSPTGFAVPSCSQTPLNACDLQARAYRPSCKHGQLSTVVPVARCRLAGVQRSSGTFRGHQHSGRGPELGYSYAARSLPSIYIFHHEQSSFPPVLPYIFTAIPRRQLSVRREARFQRRRSPALLSSSYSALRSAQSSAESAVYQTQSQARPSSFAKMEAMDYTSYFQPGSQTYNYMDFGNGSALYHAGDNNEGNGAVQVSSHPPKETKSVELAFGFYEPTADPS